MDDPLEIAFMVYEFPPAIVGGLGTYAGEITQQFVKSGHDVTVLSLNDGSLPTRDVWKGIEVHRPILIDMEESFPDFVREDIRAWGKGMEFFQRIIVYNILSSAKLLNDLVRREERRFDLVAAHDWLSLPGGFSVRRGLDIPLVFHVHSTEKGRTQGGGSRTIHDIERAGGEKADRVITVSFAMKDELVSLGFPEEKIRVCYNGVDADKYSPGAVSEDERRVLREMYQIGEDERMLFFMGRLVSVKGADRLVMALPTILENLKAKLVIVGRGEMEDHLLNLVRTEGLSEEVKFRFEFISEEERIKHYAACDAAVFPSLYEPFGIVALEAMSMEKPVVVGAKGVSGMREIVTPAGPGQCGFHVDPYNPYDIAQGVLHVFEEDSKPQFLGRNARRRVLKDFTWQKAAENTANLYLELLER